MLVSTEQKPDFGFSKMLILSKMKSGRNVVAKIYENILKNNKYQRTTHALH